MVLIMETEIKGKISGSVMIDPFLNKNSFSIKLDGNYSELGDNDKIKVRTEMDRSLMDGQDVRLRIYGVENPPSGVVYLANFIKK